LGGPVRATRPLIEIKASDGVALRKVAIGSIGAMVMSTFEIGFLTFVVGSFGAFAVVLAVTAWRCRDRGDAG
jgi:hypothetical protein